MLRERGRLPSAASSASPFFFSTKSTPTLTSAAFSDWQICSAKYRATPKSKQFLSRTKNGENPDSLLRDREARPRSCCLRVEEEPFCDGIYGARRVYSAAELLVGVAREHSKPGTRCFLLDLRPFRRVAA